MSFTFSRLAAIAAPIALLATIDMARADDLADFNIAVERAASHNRVADGYLRTGNVDLASLELDRLREAWTDVTGRFTGQRPAAFTDANLYNTTLLKITSELVAADQMLAAGKPEAARAALDAMRRDLYDLRHAAGIVVLPDCIRDLSKSADAIMVYNDGNLDLASAETRAGLAARAQDYLTSLSRCDGIADAAIRASPEFRRLVDGARAGLSLIPKAIETRDSDLVHRVLIELRSFDNLLVFRFG